MLTEADLAQRQLTILARVPTEGRRFDHATEYGSYGPLRFVVIKPVSPLPPAFLENERDCWHEPCDLAEHGYFLFPHWSRISVADVWHPGLAGGGGWSRWHRSDMVLTERGIRFIATELREIG